MVFRAIFWVGLVALLMPHEPDLGFGRPAAMDSPLPLVAAWAKQKVATDVNDPAQLCRYNVHACATTATFLDDFKAATVHSLAAVKTDIEQNGRGKLHTSGG
jgi:hypothetical protein